MPIKQLEGPIRCKTFQKWALAKGENLTRYLLGLGEGSYETDMRQNSIQGLGWERTVVGHSGGLAVIGGFQGVRTLIWLHSLAVLLVKY